MPKTVIELEEQLSPRIDQLQVSVTKLEQSASKLEGAMSLAKWVWGGFFVLLVAAAGLLNNYLSTLNKDVQNLALQLTRVETDLKAKVASNLPQKPFAAVVYVSAPEEFKKERTANGIKIVEMRWCYGVDIVMLETGSRVSRGHTEATKDAALAAIDRYAQNLAKLKEASPLLLSKAQPALAQNSKVMLDKSFVFNKITPTLVRNLMAPGFPERQDPAFAVTKWNWEDVSSDLTNRQEFSLCKEFYEQKGGLGQISNGPADDEGEPELKPAMATIRTEER